jgi:hypothetical protein
MSHLDRWIYDHHLMMRAPMNLFPTAVKIIPILTMMTVAAKAHLSWMMRMQRRQDDDFIGLNHHYEVEEGMARFEEGPNEVMPDFTNTRHHQNPRTKTYEERDEPRPAHNAGIEWQ